jgi:hypothetical protein
MSPSTSRKIAFRRIADAALKWVAMVQRISWDPAPCG